MDYNKLREIDVTGHMEKKGKFTYLSWSWAVDTLLKEDPKATWRSDPPTFFQDGTVMVYCTVEAFDKSMTMQLPVLDFKNKAISNPNAFDINTAMQRCLVKAIALYGIGLHIYSGEDLPPEDLPKEPEPYQSPIEEQYIINDICHLIRCCKCETDISGLMEEYQEDLNGFGDESCHDDINATAAEMKTVWDAGNQLQSIKYSFINVDHAWAYFVEVGSYVSSEKNPVRLEAYVGKWEYKINELESALKANKYKEKKGMGGLSPYDKLTSLYNKKIEELT